MARAGHESGHSHETETHTAVLHPINLCEGSLIVSQTQVKRGIVKVVERLDLISKESAYKKTGHSTM